MRVRFVKELFTLIYELEPIVLDFLLLIERSDDDSRKEKLASEVIALLKKHKIKLPIPDFVMKWLLLEVIEKLLVFIQKGSKDKGKVSLDKAGEGCYNSL